MISALSEAINTINLAKEREREGEWDYFSSLSVYSENSFVMLKREKERTKEREKKNEIASEF